MAYATSDEYDSNLLELASMKVDELTHGRIREIGFANLTEFQKGLVSMATLEQAKYYAKYGTDGEDLAGFSVAGISMSFNGKASPNGSSATAYCLLKQTGLLCGVLG